MIIDRSHRIWAAICCVLLVLSTVLYLLYAASEPYGPSGGSWQGLLFGVAGSALMIFAGLLSARKKVPRLPIGTAQFWLKGHIWLGLPSVPLILFHAGFRWGGLVEQALMLVLAVVILSGVFGLVLQHYLPSTIKTAVQSESMYEQIPHVCGVLRATADDKLSAVCGDLLERDNPAGTSDAEETWDERGTLREFHLTVVRPYLSADSLHDSPLASPASATATFAVVQEALPARFGTVLDELKAICDERRQLSRQARLHHWLHGWLYLHVPLSLSLLVLGVVHAIVSLYY